MGDSIVTIEDIKENREENKENVSHHPHNGKEILKIAVSPKGDYAVTYNSDNSIVGWNITEKKDHPVEEESDMKVDVEMEVEDDELETEDDEMKVKDDEIETEDDEMEVEDDEIETGDNEMEIEDDEIETGDNEMKVEDDEIKVEDDEKKVEDDEKKVKNVKMKAVNVEIKVSNRDSKMVVVMYKVGERWIHKIYKLGNNQPIKKYESNEENEIISFTLDGKIVQCRDKRIKVYSLSNTNNKLKLESVYKISIGDTLRKYGITENKIWARSSGFLYLWDLNSFHFNSYLPERSYKITNKANIDSSIYVLTGDSRQKFIFLNGFNFPVRYIENDNLSKKERDYFLVYDIFDKYNQLVKASFYYKTNTKKIYRVYGDSKIITDEKFNVISKEDECEQKFMICNLQSNKVYGVDSNNKIITADISDYNLLKSDYKDDNKVYGVDNNNKIITANINKYILFKSDYEYDDENSGWSNYLNEYDINDTIVDPDMIMIQQLLDDTKTDNSLLTFVNEVYSWEIKKLGPTIIIKVLKGKDEIDSKKITYKLIKYTLLKNNALALKVKREIKKEAKKKVDREILVIFKLYGNKIQLQYLTYLSNKSVKNESQNKNEKNEESFEDLFVDIMKKLKYILRYYHGALDDDDDDDDDVPLEDEIDQDVGYELPLGDIKSVITNGDDGSLEKEWLEFITTDYFTLLKYGSKYFRFFIEFKKEDLIRKTYNKCINLIKRDTKKNFEFLDIINSSIRILINEYPSYLNKFNQDMLIILNPTKDEPGKINSKHHVRSDCNIICCRQLPLWYYYFEMYFSYFLSSGFVIIIIIIFIPSLINAFALGLSIGFTLWPFIILFFIILSVTIYLRTKDIKPRYYNFISVLFTLLFIFPIILVLFIQLLLILPMSYYMYFFIFIYFYLKDFKDYDQSIYLTCTYNSLCCYPSEYSWFYELAFSPQSSIFIHMCQRKYYNKKSRGLSKSIRDLFSEIIKLDQTFEKKIGNIVSELKKFRMVIRNYIKYFFDIINPDKIINRIRLKVSSKEHDLDNRREFFNNLNGEAIIDFKWRTFGKYYYFLIWLIFMAFQICFIIGSLPSSFNTNELRTQLYKVTYIIGFIQLYFEFKQFIWRPSEYIYSIWNLFDLSAYLFPTITSYLWIYHNSNIPVWLISLSCLFLNIKFLLFFRAFEYFGIYFAIIFGVIRRIFPFLMILIFITISFALSFHLLLIPKDLNSLLNPNPTDPNNPWTLSKKYNQISVDGSINSESSIFIEEPDESTNLFTSFFTSLLATYLFLAGDSSSFTKWSPTADNALLMIMVVLFSFLIVIYLMNLFIGILNMNIEKDYDRGSYLVQKAEILAEIELFYLLPSQRRRKDWFPDVINYEVRMDIAQKYVKKSIDDGKWKSDNYLDSEYKDKVLKQLDILEN